MKKIISIILLLAIILSMYGCGPPTLINVERKQVDAIVVGVSRNTIYHHYVYVAYEGCKTTWYDESQSLYRYFVNRPGNTIPCYLITYTYEDNKIIQELVFNEDLWKERNSNED